MKKIPLTQGRFAIVDDLDYASLNRHKWYAMKTADTYYAVKSVRMPSFKRRVIRMHRVILNAPDRVEVDHINRDGLDNRRSNLRLCTRSENSKNQGLRSDNTSGFKGVTLLREKLTKPYRVQVEVNKKRIHVGYYRTAEIAARAYDLAILKYSNHFAVTNKSLGLLS